MRQFEDIEFRKLWFQWRDEPGSWVQCQSFWNHVPICYQLFLPAIRLGLIAQQHSLVQDPTSRRSPWISLAQRFVWETPRLPDEVPMLGACRRDRCVLWYWWTTPSSHWKESTVLEDHKRNTFTRNNRPLLSQASKARNWRDVRPWMVELCKQPSSPFSPQSLSNWLLILTLASLYLVSDR